MSRFIDVSHVVEDGMVTYRGLPAPVIRDFLSRAASRDHYAPGTEFQIGEITMCSNTGTYVDSPFHRYEGDSDLATLPLERLADLDGIKIEAPAGTRSIDADVFAGRRLEGKAVLVQTGWDRHWLADSYFENHPYLTEAAAELLVDGRAGLVGIDSLNIDDTDDPRRPVHSILLAAGIPICEHMTNLAALPNAGFRFSAVPAPVRGMGSFPVRAYAVV